MIKAEFAKVNGHYTSYTLSGHAGYAEHGKDIVCASVSSLYIAISNGLTPWMGESLENPDKSSCTLKSFDEKSNLLIETLFNGLKDISVQYPDNVRVSLRNVWTEEQGIVKHVAYIKSTLPTLPNSRTETPKGLISWLKNNAN